MLPTILISFAIAGAPVSPAPSSEPVTYSCKFLDREAGEVRFTLDQSTSTVAMYVPKSGYREMMIGFFSGENVSFANNRLVSYAINRASGSVSRMFAKANRSENGICTAV